MDSPTWYLTIVYASPHFAQRQALWDEVQELYTEYDGHWTLLEDFNAILKDFERKIPPLFHSQPLESRFQNVTNCCELLDMRFNGDVFTRARGNTRKRLDRAIWRIRFNNSEITHLPKLKSDHSPLLLSFGNRRFVNRRRKSFRFEAIWLTHTTFTQLFVDNWRSNMNNFPQQLKDLQGILIDWNKETFGNIFSQKRKLFKQLRDMEHMSISQCLRLIKLKI